MIIPSGSGGGTPVGRSSGPSIDSVKAKDNKENSGDASSTVEGGRSEVVSPVASESSTKINDALGKKFRKAVEERELWMA